MRQTRTMTPPPLSPAARPRPRSYVIRADDREVQAWTPARLPFTPKGWMVDFREALRSALAGITPAGDDVLHAIYTAQDSGEVVDVENVLLYNVGAKTLRPLMTSGVRFERAFTTPKDTELGDDYPHHSTYLMAARSDGFLEWQPKTKLARFDKIDLERADKTAGVFAAIRRQATAPKVGRKYNGNFLVRLELTPPAARGGAARSVADLVKPLLDGVLCAYQLHEDAGDLPEVTKRLSELGKPGEVGDLLLDPAWNALGQVRMVRPFGAKGVQWSPADHRCVGAEILLREPSPGPGWTVSGSLSRV
jgi:hypothetical protein